MRANSQIARCLDGHLHLLNRPCLTRFGIAAHFRHCKSVKSFVIGRMHGNKLALQMRRKLCHFNAIFARDTGKLIAIIFGFRGLLQIDQLARPCRHLNTGITFFCGPFGDAVPCIKRRFIARKLPEKYPRPFDRLHQKSSN